MENKYTANAYNSLTPDQIDYIKTKLGVLKRKEISVNLGIPEVRLKRAASFANWSFKIERLVSDIEDIIQYYNDHTLKETAKKFNLREKQVDGILWKNKVSSVNSKRIAKQVPWRLDHIVTTLKSIPHCSYDEIAKIINRPNCKGAGVKAMFSKVLKTPALSLMGLPRSKALLFVNKECPFFVSRLNVSNKGRGKSIKIYKWKDMLRHLNNDCPDSVKKAIESGAIFQDWIRF